MSSVNNWSDGNSYHKTDSSFTSLYNCLSILCLHVPKKELVSFTVRVLGRGTCIRNSGSSHGQSYCVVFLDMTLKDSDQRVLEQPDRLPVPATWQITSDRLQVPATWQITMWRIASRGNLTDCQWSSHLEARSKTSSRVILQNFSWA